MKLLSKKLVTRQNPRGRLQAEIMLAVRPINADIGAEWRS